MPSTQAPLAKDYLLHCNASVNTDVGHVKGTGIPAGTAVLASTGCGEAVLLLDVAGSGRYRASFAVADEDTSGVQATVRMRVFDRQGYLMSASVATASKGTVTQLDVDISNASSIALDFLGKPQTLLYNTRLAGGARVLRVPTGSAAGLPAGATPLNAQSASLSCNANQATPPLTVSLVTVPVTGTFTLTGCGKASLTVPSGSTGTLVARYGVADSSSGTVLHNLLVVRVLDANGTLLRKAIASAAISGGLNPIWVSLRGASSVSFSVEGNSDTRIAVTGIGILPGQLPLFPNYRHILTGGSPTRSVAVNPEAFVSKCNSYVGVGDTSIAHAPVFAGTYIVTSDCGSAGLVLTDSRGSFRAFFGVPDDAQAGAQASVRVVVLDKNSKPLSQTTVRAAYGAPAAQIAVRIDNASTLSFIFTGQKAVLYNARLTGTANLYDYVSPPVEPPATVPGALAIDPHLFTLSCNAYLSDHDVLLVHEASLENWALSGQSCGSASLALSKLKGPHSMFTGRIGIAAGEAPDTLVQVRLDVLDNAGKSVRHDTFTARYGYGPQPIRISLAGGSTLQISWPANSLAPTVVFAMAAS